MKKKIDVLASTQEWVTKKRIDQSHPHTRTENTQPFEGISQNFVSIQSVGTASHPLPSGTQGDGGDDQPNINMFS